jgi:hypothetical protein
MSDALPDHHKRALSFVITVAEFRELMRAAMYRADDIAATDGPTAYVLRSAAWKLGEAWNDADPEPAGASAAQLTKCAICGRTPRGGILDYDSAGRLVCWQATSDESWQECYPPEACL